MLVGTQFSYYWDSGIKKWKNDLVNVNEDNLNKKPVSPADFINYMKNMLEGCWIKSDQAKNRVYVQKANILFYDFTLSDITSFIFVGQYIQIFSKDKSPITLKFLTLGEAAKAHLRLFYILNGFEVIECDDEYKYRCAMPNQIQVTF